MAGNMFIKFENPAVDGGSTSKGHETEIEVLNWSHGFIQPTSPVRSHAGSGTVEKAKHGQFTFTKYMDPATDDLLKFCWSGQHVDKVTFQAYRSSGDTGGNQMGVPYLKIEMESAVVANFSVGGSQGDIPTESVTLDYGKVTYTYTQSDQTEGTTAAPQAVSHDLRTNVVA
jgi:type VI secretion system secreted protein Hcp